MLTISQPLSSGQAQRYHAEEFTSRSQAYYAQGDTVRGEWQGRLAEHFDLRGDVRTEHFARLAEGRHPHTQEQLVHQRLPHAYRTSDGKTQKTMGHRAGWDATFSAPKSASLTALVGKDVRVREAHREAVKVAIDKLETYVQARIGGNRPAEETGNWVVAKFEHDTSRPVDGYPAPQLHTHAVFFNMSRTEDGDFRAIQPREVFRAQQYGTAVYRAELGYRLRELGYELQVERNGAPEIKGYSREYLEANSPRSQQIREHLNATGRSGAAAAQIAAHRTREAKAALTPAEVIRQHRELAAAHGHQPEKVVRSAREHGARQEPDPERHARAAVTFARDKTFEREAVVDRRDLMKEALRRACGHARADHVERALDQRCQRGDLIRAHGHSRASASPAYTTPAMVASELRNVEYVRQGRDRCEPLVNFRIREKVGQSSHLSAAQRAAVNDVLSSRDRVVGFQGVAGSGKTTTLREIRTAAERDGYKVQGLAPTSRATAQLQEAGISSTTLQRHLAQSLGNSRGDRHLYVVDESSLVSTKQMQELFERAGPRDRVLMVGDTRQHQSVDAGRPFEQLQQGGMRTAKLDEIVRQRDPDLKQAVHDLAQGRVREAFSRLQEKGRVHEIPDRDARLDTVAREYASSSGRALVVAPDNQTRQELNTRIRADLKERGVVTGPDRKVEVLVPRQDMTGADRAWAGKYQEGDVVRYQRGSAQHRIRPGEYGIVREVNARENTLRVELSGGRQAEYDPRRLRGVAVYEKAERSFATGDRVQLTAPDRSSGLANRELGKIERIEPSGDMTIRTDAGRTATLGGDQKHVDHGYAVTSHSAQGATADRVIVHAESSQSSALVNQRFAYVAGSRMREGLDVYTDDAGRLESALDRRFDKSAAVTDRALGRVAATNQDAPAGRQPSQGQQRVEHGGTSQEIAHGR